MFSWIDVDGKQNITDEDKRIALLIPKEHKEAVGKVFDVEMGKNGIEGRYNAYGSVITDNEKKVDFYDVVSFLNICCTTDEQYKEVNLSGVTTKCADEIRQTYKAGKIETIDDIQNIVKNYNLGLYSSFRSIGISLAGGNGDNARLPYPIKVTTDVSRTYENSNFSMSDPNQGFHKVDIKEKSRYAFNEWDWGDGEPTIEEEEWNEETGEYETVEVDNPYYVEPYDDWWQSEDRRMFEACEELEEIDEARFDILADIREERKAKGLEAPKEIPKEEYKPDYTLVGVNGNAYAIIGYTSRALKEQGLKDKVQEMTDKATSGDYNHLLGVCMEYIDMANEVKNAPKTVEEEKDEIDLEER